MKTIIVGVLVGLSVCADVFPQGCIPVRNIAGFGQFSLPQYQDVDSKPIVWMLNVNNRYFGFNKTFFGTDDLNVPEADQNQNRSFTTEIALSRILKNGWSITLDLPVTTATRTNWQEHDPTTKIKYTTSAFGVNDIRLTVYKWLFNVNAYHKGNVQAGLGLKFPTGNYKVEDDFHKPGNKMVGAPVNTSIQLGDGGTGIIMELNSFLTAGSRLSVYGNVYYLLSPKDHNGTSTLVGNSPWRSNPANTTIEKIAKDSVAWVASGKTVTSVPDAFTIRGGANYTIRNFVFWAGLRYEGQPVHDLLGGSFGQRRAGEIISVEPGINYQFKKVILYLFAPIPIYRNSKLTEPDKIYAEMMGGPKASPGGFADFMVMIGGLVKI